MNDATPCLDENAVSALLSGAIGAAERGAIEEHLDRCPDCRTLVSSVTIALHEPTPDAELGDDATPPSASLRRGDSLGRYVVLDVVGIGNMGVVYGAYDPDLDRRLAVKVLHQDADRHRALAWREAKSMARISHPNIVTVHDVGVDGDRVFVAMEFVDGTTLRTWQDEEKRSWQEVLSRYVEAGRGLAAAHEAGIVHRDFKPDNVLVGKDGWVRVSDLGLAAVVELASTHEDDPSLTTGVGTPRYMAPELHDGCEATPKSDQFAFCVSLYEALYAEHPFAAESRRELAIATARNRIRPAPEGASVPPALRRLVLTGLAPEPTERHPQMASLLEKLQRLRDPRRAPTLAMGLGAAAAVVGAAVVGAAAFFGTTERPCPARDLEGIWSAEVRQALGAQLDRSGSPRAATLGRLDAFARDWSTVHRETCLATHERHTRTVSDLELSGACLERRRFELETLLTVAGDGRVLDAAELTNAIDTLVEPTRCRDVEALRAEGSPPAQQYLRPLARADALIRTGDLAAGREIAVEVAASARDEDDPASEAAALLTTAWADVHAGRASSAEALLYDTLAQAERAAQPSIRFRAMSLLVFAVGYQQGRHEDGKRWAGLAEALSGHAGVEEIELARLTRYRAIIAGEQGEYETSKRLLDDVLRRIERIERITHPLYGKTHAELGRTLLGMGRVEEAEVAFRRARDLAVERLGPDNLDVANAVHGLGDALVRLERYEEARREFHLARRIFLDRYGPSDPRLAAVDLGIGRLELAAGGDLDAAERALLQAKASLESQGRTRSIRYIKALSSLSRVWIRQDRPSDAIRLLSKAVEFGDDGIPGHPLVDELRFQLGRLHREQGDAHRARTLLEAALTAAESDPDRRRDLRVRALVQLSHVDLEAGETSSAAAALEQAAQLADHSDVDTELLGEIEGLRARLRATPGPD